MNYRYQSIIEQNIPGLLKLPAKAVPTPPDSKPFRLTPQAQNNPALVKARQAALLEIQ